MVAKICDLSTWKAEDAARRMQGQPCLPSKFESYLGYMNVKKKKNLKLKLDVVAHTGNPSTQEAEVGGSVS